MTVKYTLVIGSKNVSSWSLRAWLPMKVANIPFDEIVVPLYQQDTRENVLKHSPSGKVPLLQWEENNAHHAVWDSLAICETLAERHPDKHLWPEMPSARAHARSISAEMHAGFPDVRRQLSMDISARKETPALEDVTREQVDRIAGLWIKALAHHKDGGFLFGHFTIADGFYAPVVTRFATYQVPLPPEAQAYCDRILALPAMREWAEAAKAKPVTAA